MTIAGSSTNKTVLRGSLVKWGAGTATLRRLKMEVEGDTGEEREASVYLMAGATEIEGCVVEAPVNTAFYVIR